MTDITRRDALQGLLAIPAGLALSPDAVERARAHVAEALVDQGTPAKQGAAQPAAYQPKQFSPDEWHLVRLLVDDVIPRDAHSGSATEAGVPEFMDFILGEYASNQQWMRDGLAWMNAECRRRFDKGFVSCTVPQRHEVLDAIAFPQRAAPEMRAGVEFLNRFRNLTASGYYSSRIGIADLGYVGNRPVAEWEGTPPEVMKWLGP
ncbi:MAG: gluconate 2-dehydrogenase subunit 3 family protein [Gemmatimonadota bacterium]|nr:gluconate 2-dehydrogenase subunit 3 family protein [Gemmatimonadota bacterium]